MALGPWTELGAVLPSERTVVSVDAVTCVCAHGQDAHEHYRPGTDCALCDCPRYRPRR